jgi:nicotinamide-nucleotide amidase
MNAVILATGDELVLGQNTDTNSVWLSGRLASRGVMTLYHKTVGDDLDAIAGALREAAQAAELVILTGGLGPTRDDLTREAFARVLGVPLELHEPSLERIRLFFQKLGRPMPETNHVQALYPRGADVLDNDWGTAPGIAATIGSARAFAFPGVPGEMEGMFERYVLPITQNQSGRAILTETMQTFGAGESLIAEKLGNLMRRDCNPLVGTTASGGVVAVRIRSDYPSAAKAERELADVVLQVEKRLGDLVFGRGGISLAQAVGNLLKSRWKTVATAESCTGGLVGKLLTDVPGSSVYYRGGWVVYSNRFKERELGISMEIIIGHGAVSEQVARLMAENAVNRTGADYALALTGIAGPDGGSVEKPVGTVWIAMARKAPDGPVVSAECFKFPGNRDMVRDRAAKTALNMLRLDLMKEHKGRIKP